MLGLALAQRTLIGRKFRLVVFAERPGIKAGDIVRVVDVSESGYLKVVLDGSSTMTYIGGKDILIKEVF